jgi:hypothetical protein
MGLLVIKHMSDSSVFLTGLTTVAIIALVLGYFIYSHSPSKKREREISIAFRSRGINTPGDMISWDISPRQLKARIMQILVNNTMDLDVLNNVTDHVLNKIDADMQDGGLLHGMIVERSIGRITRKQFNQKLATYVKQMAASLSVPLMNRDHGYGSFVRRYIEGGGGSGGTGYGTLYGRAKNIYKSASLYGLSARRAYPANRSSRGIFPMTAGSDAQIEILDDRLRRF